MPNVYRYEAAPETLEQRMAAVALWAGPDAAVSHRTALKVWGFDLAFDTLEVVTAQRRDSSEGIRVHRVRRLPKSHLTQHRGVRVTTLERTMMDLAALGDSELLKSALLFAFERGLLTYGRLRAFLEDASTRGLPGRRLLTKVLWERRQCALVLPGDYAETVRMFMRREGLPPLPDENLVVSDWAEARVPLGDARLKVAVMPRWDPGIATLERLGWRVVCLAVKDLFCDPEYCAYLISAALAAVDGDFGAPRRRWPVRRPWLDKHDAMRIRERIKLWRWGNWGWYHLAERDFRYDPVLRRDWEFEQATGWVGITEDFRAGRLVPRPGEI